MKKITKKAAKEVLAANPEWDREAFTAWAKEINTQWHKNSPRFFGRVHSLYSEFSVKDAKPVIGGCIEGPDKRREKAQGKTFVLTCAQSNTKLHDSFFASLLSLCEHRNAELHISRFTYNKASHGKKSVKPNSTKASDTDDIWFDARIEPYISDESLEITPDLIWCGEMNITPTAVNPISGLQNYTRQASSIIPHAKLAMESVPTMKYNDPKFVYTTGAVTQRNYIQKASGQKADFHHVFGALLVEVDDDGLWWVRQLNASEDGEFYDLNYKYTPSGHSKELTVEAITHGDLHGYKLDHGVKNCVFGQDGVLDTLAPAKQFFHDTIDFMPRNHHNMKDPMHFRRMHKDGTDSVEMEFKIMGLLLASTMYRKWCKSYVVVSNHDQAINTWLDNTAGHMDATNMLFWHELNAWRIRNVDNKDDSPFTYALNKEYMESIKWHLGENARYNTLEFLHEDDSYMLLGEIETALHGHLGPNGARGTPKNLRGAGKVNSAHTHSAGIFEGVYTCGVYGKLDMGYNKGLSSWSHSFTLTYSNAKRAICTIKNGKAWR